MIKIREARNDEWNKLQDLNNMVIKDNNKYDPDIIVDWAHSDAGRSYFKELVKDSNKLCLVAETQNGTLIGYIAGSPKQIDYRISRYFEIENMGVFSQYRSQGLGTKLMKAALKWASEKGYQKAIVNSYTANTGAINFYNKCGFETIDVTLERNI